MQNDSEQMLNKIISRFDTDRKLVVSSAYGDGGTAHYFKGLCKQR